MTSPDADLIRERLGPEGPRFELLAEVDSTNTWLLEAPFTDAPAQPRAVLAHTQRAGRGRRGRSWLAEPGRSLALSLAFERPGSAPPAPGLSLAVGCEIARALSAHCAGLALKWPNDLLRAGAKCGGILIESRSGRAGERPLARVVVGVGLNLLAPIDPQAQIGQRASGLYDPGVPIPVEQIIVLVIRAIADAWAGHLKAGLEPFLQTWARLDAWHGREVILTEAGTVIARGRSLGIARDGALRLLTGSGERQFVAGDVSLRSGTGA